MAAETLLALHLDDRFDLVIVDTPPTRNALDFLDAPRTLARFLDHPIFKLMMMPTRRGLRVLSVAAQPLLRSIGKVIGTEVLADALAFFQAFDGMETGFRNRADDVIELLHGETTRFVLVASPRVDTIDEARFFADTVGREGSRCRRNHRQSGDTRLRRADRQASSGQPERRSVRQPGGAPRPRRRRTRATICPADRPIPADSPTWVPLLPGDVHDLDGLDKIRDTAVRRFHGRDNEPVGSSACTSWSPPMPTTSSTTSPLRSAVLMCRSPSAATAATSPASVKLRTPDLVVLDLQIGSMGGMAVTMALRLDESSAQLPHVPVLMLLDREADIHLAKRCAADGYLVKPLDPLSLEARGAGDPRTGAGTRTGASGLGNA